MKRVLFFVVAGSSLACAGVFPPAVEVDPSASPLVIGQRYWFDKDKQETPVFDVDRTFQFESDGTCRHLFESKYKCTFTVAQSGETWTVNITAYTEGKDPDGNPVEVDLQPETLGLSADGQTLTGPDGQIYLLQSGDDKGRKSH